MSRPQKVKKETAAQRKLREAQELVKAAKKKEQEAWRAKWAAQQKDPAYIAKQARLAETREERSRKMAIGKENAQLARIAKLMEQAGDRDELEHTAYHEAGHAVIYEVLANGVTEATIIPRDESKDSNSEHGSFSLGHVNPYANRLPIPEYERNLYAVAGYLSGGLATYYVYDDEDGSGTDKKYARKIIESMALDKREELDFWKKAYELCFELMADSKIWAAIEEVKEALLTYKTIPGDMVRAIVKKQYHPDLFPVVITKQLSFHYRKEFFTSYFGSAPYSLGIGDHSWGFTLSNPKYIVDFLEKTKADTKEQPSRRQVPAVQLKLPLEGVIDEEGVIDLEPIDLKPRSNRSRARSNRSRARSNRSRARSNRSRARSNRSR
jgi:hypothetical protein